MMSDITCISTIHTHTHYIILRSHCVYVNSIIIFFYRFRWRTYIVYFKIYVYMCVYIYI